VGTAGPNGIGLPQFGSPHLPILYLFTLWCNFFKGNSVGESYPELSAEAPQITLPDSTLCACKSTVHSSTSCSSLSHCRLRHLPWRLPSRGNDAEQG
jgi:hypothetical protein